MFFTDPFIYHALRAKALGRTKYWQHTIEWVNSRKDQLLEMVVASQLARNFPVYYWKGNHEVDTVVQVGDELIAVEVKNKKHISRSDMHGIFEAVTTEQINGGIIATKNTLEEREMMYLIPIPLLLYLVGRK